MRIYYFTKAEHAMDNLKKKRIKISQFDNLNDPFELKCFNIGNKIFRNEFKKTYKDILKKKKIICFSETWRNPVMWGMYADKCKGVVLGFNVPESKVKKITYIDTLYELEEWPKSPNDEIIDKLTQTKFIDWQFEKEQRMFIDSEKLIEEKGKQFILFSDACLTLNRVIIGPNCSENIEKINCDYIKDKFKSVTVIKTRSAFRSFNLTQNLRHQYVEENK